MALVDSLDKIITVYFRSVTQEPFTYKGKTYAPGRLRVSPLILRGFTCPEVCGGCCPRFSLDYLPTERRPSYITNRREVEFNGQQIAVYSDAQTDHNDHHCRNLNKTDGRCGVYLERPFSCDFELIRFFVSDEGSRLSQQLFGRGWAMLRVDNQRGARCTITEPDDASIRETIRKLNRLERWAVHFHLRTWVPTIIDWIFSGDTSKPLVLE